MPVGRLVASAALLPAAAVMGKDGKQVSALAQTPQGASLDATVTTKGPLFFSIQNIEKSPPSSTRERCSHTGVEHKRAKGPGTKTDISNLFHTLHRTAASKAEGNQDTDQKIWWYAARGCVVPFPKDLSRGKAGN